MPEKELELPNDEEFKESKTSLREDYNDLRNAQGVRILTLFVFLLAVLETIINSEKINAMFSNLPIINLNIMVFGINLFDLIKPILFILLIIGIFFYAFRSYFRFRLTSRYIDELYWLTKDDLKKLPEKTKEKFSWFQEKRWAGYLIEFLSLKLAGKLKDSRKRERIFLKIYYDDFMPSFDEANVRWGYFWCLLFAIIAAVMLLFIIM